MAASISCSRPGKSGSEEFLVQCKQWRAFKVGVVVVRKLYGVMAAKGAAGGLSGRPASSPTTRSRLRGDAT
jgi:hypothetical protein